VAAGRSPGQWARERPAVPRGLDLQLRAALAYKKSTGLRLGTAAVALGFVSEQKIEWASLAYHGQHRRAAMQ
jgi:hypothetical protein